MFDINGYLIKIKLTGGNVHDRVPTVCLLNNIKSNYLLADKTYDSIKIVNHIKNKSSKTVILFIKNNFIHQDYDKKTKKEILYNVFLIKLNVLEEFIFDMNT